MSENREKLTEAFPTLMVSVSDGRSNGDVLVKSEQTVMVKCEPQECVVCTSRGVHAHDIYTSKTLTSGSSLFTYLSKFTPYDISKNGTKLICKSCYELLNVLEQAEQEYLKLKQAFEEILSKNPIFDNEMSEVLEVPVKKENYDGQGNEDSEDEPLAVSRKKQNHKIVKKKKRNEKFSKRKVKSSRSNSDRWSCRDCGESGRGGDVAETAHRLAAHTLNGDVVIKKEDETDTDGIQNSNYGNEFTTNEDFEMEFEFEDDEDYILPDDDTSSKELEITIPKKRGRKAATTELKCSECNATYRSISRLENHKMMKHSGFGPPYICEICGAKYKHKRACDIHIQLHKGISDWKCDECNKLFPSKGALRRHNNIHTGNAMYQCDLCGKSFIHTSSFKMHKLSHSGVKPHSCSVCGLALLTSSHLKRHLRIHTGEKRFDCNVCGKKFSERYNMLAHAKSHEALAGGGGCGGGGGGGGGGEARGAGEVVRRRFRCLFCADRFERKYMLERHMSVEHGRTLERAPPTPRNTMSKLLKQQASDSLTTTQDCDAELILPESQGGSPPAPPQAAAPPAPPPEAPAPTTDLPCPTDRHKLNITIVSSSGAWSSGSSSFSQEFRNNYSH